MRGEPLIFAAQRKQGIHELGRAKKLFSLAGVRVGKARQLSEPGELTAEDSVAVHFLSGFERGLQ